MTARHDRVFQVGSLYSSEDIQRALGVGNAGGVRISVGKDDVVQRAVVMTSAPMTRQEKENPYFDRIEGDTLVYTGTGREGDQLLAGVNRRLPQQALTGFPIYGFLLVGSRRDTSIGPKRWKFLGLLEYLRHYPDAQMDARAEIRKVWLFEFRIHNKPELVIANDDSIAMKSILSESRAGYRELGDEGTIVETPAISDPHGKIGDSVELEGIRSHLLAKSPEHFEHFIKDLLIATGYERVNVTRFNQDGGIDVNAYASSEMWPVENMLVQFQAKRWLHTVGRKEIAELRESLEQFARGVVVTTSHYSKAAILEASSVGKVPIVLVDGYSLARIVQRIGIRVA